MQAVARAQRHGASFHVSRNIEWIKIFGFEFKVVQCGFITLAYQTPIISIEILSPPLQHLPSEHFVKTEVVPYTCYVSIQDLFF